MRKIWMFSICLLIATSGLRSDAASLKTGAKRSVTSVIEQKCKQSIRAVRLYVQPFHLKDGPTITYMDYKVCVITANGTALGRYQDFVGVPSNTARYNIDAAIAKRAVDAAFKRRHKLLAADGKIYEYKVTAIGADCDTVIIKPVKPIPVQPYLDISRLAVPVLAQRYRACIGPNNPLYKEKPRFVSVTVNGMISGPMSCGSGLLFRESDGSFIGYNSPIGEDSVVMNSTKPLMRFVEANSTVRFKKKLEPKAVYSDVYHRIMAQTPPYMQYLFQSSKTKHYLNARFLRSDGLAIDHNPMIDQKTADTTQIAMWGNREHMMRFVRLDSGLAGGLWMPVEKLKIRALTPAKPMKRQLKPNEIIFGVEYDDFSETPVISQARVTTMSGHTVYLERSTLGCWIFNSQGQPLGMSMPGNDIDKPHLLPLDELLRQVSSAR